MFRMAEWQWMTVGLVALVCVGGMAWTVYGIFSRRAGAPAVLREATAFESARAGSTAPEGASAFDGYSYRVPGRMAGRVRMVVDGDRVSISGPRVPSVLYQLWIWFQALTLALVPAAIVAAAVKLDWRWLLAALGIFLISWTVSCIGAVAWPGLGELDYIEKGRFKAVEFPVTAVHDIKVGKGWSDGGIDVVLLPYKAGIDVMAGDKAISFFAPDDEGRDVRYAIHMPADVDVAEVVSLLTR